MTDPRAVHLISAAALARRPAGDIVVLDVRVDADGRADESAHRRGHIPGARFVDLDADLAGEVTPRSGARPLPKPRDLQRSIGRWGITSPTTVVVHDDSTGAAAARAWWVLRWAGLRDVRFLDGGLRAWTAAGGDLATGSEQPHDGRGVRVRPGALPVVDIDEVIAVTRRAVLLDARPAALFAGSEGGAAHIPGAISAPVFDDFDARGLLRPAHEVADRYRLLGVDVAPAEGGASAGDTVAAASYCSSGVAAALQVLVLATLGVEAALYPGSLSQWVADPTRLTIGAATTPRPTTPRPTADIA